MLRCAESKSLPRRCLALRTLSRRWNATETTRSHFAHDSLPISLSGTGIESSANR